MNDGGPACPLPFQDATTVQMGHGGGGLMARRFLEEQIVPRFDSAPLRVLHDGAVLEMGGVRWAFTTDGHVVRPLEFPGGDIGTLAVNGTVNDLAMCGARPRWLSVSLILEEGLPKATLARILDSMARAARQARVEIVTGDTKVVDRGHGDGVYVSTSGIGEVVSPTPIAPTSVRPGDVVILSGDLGRHGISILSVREGLRFECAVVSDCAPLADPVLGLLAAGIEVHCLRDLTRGGLAAALQEIAIGAGLGIEIEEEQVPVCGPVRAACEVLGLDPIHVANEGRFVAFVPADALGRALAVLREHAVSADAMMIGRVTPGTAGRVVLRNGYGGKRVLTLPTAEQMPRIC